MHQINSSGISLYHQPIADVEKNTPKTSHTPERDSDKEYTRRYIEISKSEWWRVILFCLSMSLMGLKFPLGYLFVPMCLISSWRNSRYDFIIQFTIFVGGYAFLSDSTLPFKTEDLAMLLGVIGVFIYRKPPIVKKVLVAVGIYAAALIILAMFSDERMGIQIRTMRYWLCFIYFMVPLMAFAGQNFDIRELMKKIFPYVLVISVFYILDCFIVNGNLFVPNSFVWDSAGSTWNNLALSGFGSFPRKFPPGMYWLLMVVAPIARYYKLKWWQWLLIVGALIAARTFTLIITTVIGLMLFQPKVGRLVGYSVIAIFLFSIAYSIDSSLPKRANGESAMRIKSSIDQIISLGEVEDDEDLSKFGTGRIAQALPIMDLMTAYNKQAVGLGFLHPELTTNTRYIIINDYLDNVEESVRVATGVECSPLQVYVTVGYIGLIIHLAFFISLWVFVRRLKYSWYFLSILLLTFILGLSGMTKWIDNTGQFLLALSFSAVLLENHDQLWSHIHLRSLNPSAQSVTKEIIDEQHK